MRGRRIGANVNGALGREAHRHRGAGGAVNAKDVDLDPWIFGFGYRF